MPDEQGQPKTDRVRVTIHKSSSKDGNVGWTISANEEAMDDQISETLRKVLAEHIYLSAKFEHITDDAKAKLDQALADEAPSG